MVCSHESSMQTLEVVHCMLVPASLDFDTLRRGNQKCSRFKSYGKLLDLLVMTGLNKLVLVIQFILILIMEMEYS